MLWFLFLIFLAGILLLWPSFQIYSKCLKFDDRTPSFFKVLIKMPYYIEKSIKIDKTSYNKQHSFCRLWYLSASMSFLLLVFAMIILFT